MVIAQETISFIDNPVIRGREDRYTEIKIKCALVIESWRTSLFSYEWLRPDGGIKSLDELSATEQPKRASVETALAAGAALEKPVLGIGILDNVEIGSGRAVFLTLAAHGIEEIPVHVPKSHEKDFAAFTGAAVKTSRKPKKPPESRAGESGNVLFYILMAVGLLAALSYAVSQSGRGTSSGVTGEQQGLMAADIIDYSETISKAVAQLRLRGIGLADLSFAHAEMGADYGVPGGADAETEIFHSDGGAIIHRLPQRDALSGAGGYIFTAANAVNGVGSTCGDETCTDLIMLTGPLTSSVCDAINRRLDIGGSAPPVVTTLSRDVPFNPTPNNGTDLDANDSALAASIAAAGTIAAAPLQFKNAGCLRDGASGPYYYYRVLIAR